MNKVIVDYFYHTLDQANQNDWGLEMRCITWLGKAIYVRLANKSHLDNYTI